jgi:hypothetical protein
MFSGDQFSDRRLTKAGAALEMEVLPASIVGHGHACTQSADACMNVPSPWNLRKISERSPNDPGNFREFRRIQSRLDIPRPFGGAALDE